ncbi:MAG: hypothetical protein JWM14_1645 [Chitinophagaceae bacterium]|nr:hypothetical protein [Chitinophagaceae bacterium]
MKKLALVCTLVMKENLIKRSVFTLMLMLVFVSSQAQTTFTSTGSGGPWNVGSTWVGGTVPGTNDDVVIAAGATVTVPSTQTCRLLTVNGTLNMANTGITLNITNNSTSTLGLTLGSGSSLFIGSANTLNFSTTQSTGILNNGGTIVSTGTNGADGGTIQINSSSGGGFEIGGTAGTVVNTLNFLSNANFYISSPSLLINGTFTIPNNNWGWNGSSKSPIYGPASTLYVDRSNQGLGTTNPFGAPLDKAWSAQAGTIGVTPGYPNNVTLVDMGSSVGGTGGTGWVPTGAVGLNGALRIGDGTTNGRISLENVTSFTSGGIIVDNNSLIVGPPAGATFTDRGNFTLQGATTGIFQSMGATINFNGSGTSASPQLISTTGTSVQFTNMTVSNNTYVRLQDPVSITSTLNLTAGFIGTTTTNSLSINNTATTAITGGSATAYVDGPLSWSIPATTTAAYTYPIGDHANGNAYLPLVLHPNTTSGATTTATAFNVNSGGSPGPTVTALSTTEYWSVTTSSAFTSGPLVDVTRPSAVAPNNALAVSSSANGVYNAIGGTPGGNKISGGGIGTASPAFIVMVRAPLSVVKLSGTNTTCNSTTGSLTVGGSGGTGPYQYSIDGGSFQASGTFTSLTPGDHNVTVKDATTATSTAVIKVLGSVVINGNNADVIICPPAGTTLMATNLQNTTPVFKWYLNSTGTGAPVFTGANYTVSPATPTTYYVKSDLYNNNLITNGGFESGNTGFTSTYANYTGAQYATTPGNNGYYSISNQGINQCQYFSTTGVANQTSLPPHTGGFYFIGDGATTSTDVWSETISGLTIGLVYKFQFYYAAADPDATHAVLHTVISGGTLSGSDVTASSATAWTQALYTFTATGTSATITLSNLTSTGSTNGNDFYLDDMEFLEPCSVISSINVLADCALPVELTDFNATRKGSGALLTWGTASELNSVYFSVEKSLDGTSFSPIGKVNAAGNSSSLKRYDFTDPSIASGLTYYRLAQYDVDGTVHYSQIRALHKDGVGEVEIVPNPSNGVFVVTVNSVGDVKSRVVVLNVLGQVVYEEGKSTANYRNVDISNLASGTYYLQVSTAEDMVVKKVIKD